MRSVRELCQLEGCSRTRHPDYEYCGKSHGIEAMRRRGQQQQSWPPASSMSLFNQQLDQNPRRGTCKLPGCSMQAFPGYDYCGRTHGKQASQPQQPIDQTPSVRQLNLFDQKLPDDASFPFPREYAQPTLALPCDQPGCHCPASEGYTECGTKECNKARLRRRIEPIVQELKDANLKCLNPDCNESLEWGNFCSRPCEVRVQQQEATRAWEQRTKLEHQSREGEYTRSENLTFDGLRKCAGLHCTKSAVVGYEPFCGQECKTTHAQLEDDDPAKVNISQATFNVLLKQADELRKEIPSKCANPPCSYPPFKNRKVCSKRCLMELEAHRSGSK